MKRFVLLSTAMFLSACGSMGSDKTSTGEKAEQTVPTTCPAPIATIDLQHAPDQFLAQASLSKPIPPELLEHVVRRSGCFNLVHGGNAEYRIIVSTTASEESYLGATGVGLMGAAYVIPFTAPFALLGLGGLAAADSIAKLTGSVTQKVVKPDGTYENIKTMTEPAHANRGYIIPNDAPRTDLEKDPHNAYFALAYTRATNDLVAHIQKEKAQKAAAAPPPASASPSKAAPVRAVKPKAHPKASPK